MKKVFAFLLTFVLLLSVTSVFAAPADIEVRVDGTEVVFDVKPLIISDHTMVPIRKTAEVLGAEVTWDDSVKTATITYDDRVVKMIQNDPNIYINDIRISMDTAVTNVDSRILIPVRYLAEALDAAVMWDHNERIVEIVTERHYVTIGENKITVGDSVSGVVSIFGQPDRIDTGTDRFDWYVYNSDYSKFMMVGVLDGKVISIYTAFTDFTYDGGIKYGDVLTEEVDLPSCRVYVDSLNGNTVYGVWVGSAYGSDKFLKENISTSGNAAELEISDITNAFRLKNNLTVLIEDETATKVSRAHSQDMAENDYFGHTNLKNQTPWDRYDNAKGKYYACTESIAGGEYSPINTFDSWLNSSDHRANLLHEKAMYAGVGISYNEDSEYGFYTTQMFSYKK